MAVGYERCGIRAKKRRTTDNYETKLPRQRWREGFTTGACAAAAAQAGARVLVRNVTLAEIATTLPNKRQVVFALKRCQRDGPRALCSVVKDAGDDPDCTHGAELVAHVELKTEPGVVLRGGPGVATVTKPGLGLEVGGPAINPVPRRNITEMVLEELAGSPYRGALVTIEVPGGEALAKKTLNARLGLLGGISILGTTGIVKPYSTASWKASVIQAIDVAAYRGAQALVFTTGGRSEQAGMKLFPDLAEERFIQMGDFVGIAFRHAAAKNIPRAILVAMMGKLSKIAAGITYTHACQGEVDMHFLAGLAAELGGSESLQREIRQANTARQVLDLARTYGLWQLPDALCRHAAEKLRHHVERRLAVEVCLVDFDGAPLGRYPALGAQPAPEVAAGSLKVDSGRSKADCQLFEVKGGANMEPAVLHDMRQMTGRGRAIEDESFSIIDREAGPHCFPPDQWEVVRRVIHSTADFEFLQLLAFHPDAIRAGVTALRRGCPILIDVKMIAVGLNEERLAAYGCRIYQYISDAEVMAAAQRENSTRAIEAMRKAHREKQLDGAIVAIGNAPTALLEVVRLVKEEAARPALIIGVPVGFVSAPESKQAVASQPTVPWIVSRGRKGGSPIAVAIIHALLRLSVEPAVSKPRSTLRQAVS